jgi:hypothetical protein
MASNLVVEFYNPEEAQFMTFDAAHWGMEVNLVKVQLIMNVLKAFSTNT